MSVFTGPVHSKLGDIYLWTMGPAARPARNTGCLLHLAAQKLPLMRELAKPSFLTEGEIYSACAYLPPATFSCLRRVTFFHQRMSDSLRSPGALCQPNIHRASAHVFEGRSEKAAKEAPQGTDNSLTSFLRQALLYKTGQKAALSYASNPPSPWFSVCKKGCP